MLRQVFADIFFKINLKTLIFLLLCFIQRLLSLNYHDTFTRLALDYLEIGYSFVILSSFSAIILVFCQVNMDWSLLLNVKLAVWVILDDAIQELKDVLSYLELVIKGLENVFSSRIRQSYFSRKQLNASLNYHFVLFTFIIFVFDLNNWVSLLSCFHQLVHSQVQWILVVVIRVYFTRILDQVVHLRVVCLLIFKVLLVFLFIVILRKEYSEWLGIHFYHRIFLPVSGVKLLLVIFGILYVGIVRLLFNKF